jgi:hypothetical protein
MSQITQAGLHARERRFRLTGFGYFSGYTRTRWRQASKAAGVMGKHVKALEFVTLLHCYSESMLSVPVSVLPDPVVNSELPYVLLILLIEVSTSTNSHDETFFNRIPGPSLMPTGTPWTPL